MPMSYKQSAYCRFPNQRPVYLLIHAFLRNVVKFVPGSMVSHPQRKIMLLVTKYFH